ncbi:hypothetical protein Cni_G14072 [Canna indica]|uniref:Uncharacterized protein n=1 Tax=Canna indica TaxID=4628 RepID=A0AAQ3KCA5_9LILI|nr:hypothetical protein Cni_G14072 [Canna indica]
MSKDKQFVRIKIHLLKCLLVPLNCLHGCTCWLLTRYMHPKDALSQLYMYGIKRPIQAIVRGHFTDHVEENKISRDRQSVTQGDQIGGRVFLSAQREGSASSSTIPAQDCGSIG